MNLRPNKAALSTFAALAVIAVALIGFIPSPTIIDPNDPRFDPTTFRFEDYLSDMNGYGESPQLQLALKKVCEASRSIDDIDAALVESAGAERSPLNRPNSYGYGYTIRRPFELGFLTTRPSLSVYLDSEGRVERCLYAFDRGATAIIMMPKLSATPPTEGNSASDISKAGTRLEDALDSLCRTANKVQEFDALLVDRLGAQKSFESTTAEKIYVWYRYPPKGSPEGSEKVSVSLVFDSKVKIERCSYSLGDDPMTEIIR